MQLCVFYNLVCKHSNRISKYLETIKSRLWLAAVEGHREWVVTAVQ